MTISSDEYKTELCGLTDNECVGHDCRTCEVAVEHKKTFSQCAVKETAEGYTTFEWESSIKGIKILSNRGRTMAKADMTTLKALQEINIVPTQTVGYAPANFPCFTANLRKLRQYNYLPIPDEIWAPLHPDWQNHAIKPTVAAFRWGEVVYLIAPCIEQS